MVSVKIALALLALVVACSVNVDAQSSSSSSTSSTSSSSTTEPTSTSTSTTTTTTTTTTSTTTSTTTVASTTTVDTGRNRSLKKTIKKKFKRFYKLLKKFGLHNLLKKDSGAGQLTLFTLSNDEVGDLNSAHWTLAEVKRYIVDGYFPWKVLKKLTSITNQAGENLTVKYKKAKKQGKINGVKILDTNIKAENGVAHQLKHRL